MILNFKLYQILNGNSKYTISENNIDDVLNQIAASVAVETEFTDYALAA